MRIFEYSGLISEIPADIFDSIVAIERIKALDHIRVKEYSSSMPEAEEAMPSVAGHHAAALMGDIPSPGYADALRTLIGFSDPISFDPGIAALNRAVAGTEIPQVPGTGDRMAQLDESYRMADSVDVHPLLIIPAAVLDMINVSPFGVHTLPTAMVMMQALLISHGYPALRCVPLESMADPEEFAEALDDSSAGWEDGANDPFPFIRWVCDAVLRCEERFDTVYPLDMGRGLDKATRILRIISSSRTPLSKAEICAMAPDISRRTADSVIAELLDARLIEKSGSFKDAKYSSQDPDRRADGRTSRPSDSLSQNIFSGPCTRRGPSTGGPGRNGSGAVFFKYAQYLRVP